MRNVLVHNINCRLWLQLYWQISAELETLLRYVLKHWRNMLSWGILLMENILEIAGDCLLSISLQLWN